MAKTKILRNIKPGASALIWGVGNSGDYYGWGEADKNAVEWRLATGAATGDSRGIYARLKFYGAGGGEAGRFFANVSAANVATGGTVNGIHSSLGIDASSSVSGAGNALRATLGASAETRTLSGTLAALLVDSDIATGNTLPATHSFIRFGDVGAVRFTNLFQIPNASNGTIFAAHTTQAMSHSIKIISDNGTPYYIMCASAATNRS